MNKKTRLIVAGSPMLIVLFVVVLFYVLEQHAAYHSPLYGAELEWTPRKQGLKDLREWAAQKAMEEARRAELLRNLNTEKMVVLGRDIVHGRGLCFNCHKIGEAGRGTQGPDLVDIGARAGNRVAGLSDVEYLAQSLYEPDAFTAPGFRPTMVPANGPPVGLDDLEILMVIAYLQSLGGTPTITPNTKLSYAAESAARVQ
ncbi:c-type cytochrome [Acidobacteria bacterium AH-259-G07]|nr:c-type cytochrome [Acidobacteria bacterium AH-259-G07]